MATMILRKWTANIRTADVDEYARYVESTGAGEYRNTAGNLGYQIVVRDLGDGTSEFSTLSWWDSMAAIKAFAGDQPEIAQYYPEDERYLLTRPETVDHFRVLADQRPGA
jgi:heme-degrading monooxygenase HmoA